MQFCECTLKVILSSSQCMNIFSQFFDAFQDMVECSCLRKLQDDQSCRNCNDHADQSGSTPANEHEYQCGQCIYADAVTHHLRQLKLVWNRLTYAVGGYFRAQFKIMGIVFLILAVGLGFLRVHYFVLSAFLIAFLDFLPFFGTGTAMIPWAIYAVFMGDYKRAVVLVVVYAITQIVRQLIQPKLVGDSVGLNPLVTLLLIYIGYRIGGVIWMILAVPVGMVIINMCQAGAFDYIFDDIKTLIVGILKLRDEE